MAARSLGELRSAAKRDPGGHEHEVSQQLQHFNSLLQAVQLQPKHGVDELVPLVETLAHLVPFFPSLLANVPSDALSLLHNTHPSLPRSASESLLQSLALICSKRFMAFTSLLPTLSALLQSHSKRLRSSARSLLVNHIAFSNRHTNASSLNRPAQSLLHSQLQQHDESIAKQSLGIVAELYRRNVWTDPRTVNLVVTASLHPKQRVMLSALKFLIGQDEQDAATGSDDDESDDDDSDDASEQNRSSAASKRKRKSKSEAVNDLSQDAVFRAYHKGTAATKKKKQKKLKRDLATLKKRSSRGVEGDSAPKVQGARFAALQLVNDPQGTTESLFSRLRSSGQSFESKLLLIQVVSRFIGTHKLLLLQFYPFIMRFTHPQQRDCTLVMASIVQATHDLVPPDTLEPLVRHIVDSFVHDHARPEVIALGLHTVREMCARAPLIMNGDLLQDLALYKKYKEKAVTAAARSLIQLFRELAPALLQKKDRGKGHDVNARRSAFGEDKAAERVPGADLLEAALQKKEDGDDESSDEEDDREDEHKDDGDNNHVQHEQHEASVEERNLEEASEHRDDRGDAADGADEEGTSAEESDENDPEDHGNKEHSETDDEVREERHDESRDQEGESERADEDETQGSSKQAGSLSSLKQQLRGAQRSDGDEGEGSVELEKARILSQADYKKIRMLKTKQEVEKTMSKHGVRKAQQIGSSEVEATVRRSTEDRVDPLSLVGEHRRKPSKEEKKARIMQGREDREPYTASAKKKKKKKGGSTNREKEKQKRLPLAARNLKAAERRMKRGHKRK